MDPSKVEFYGTSITYHKPTRTITMKVSTDIGYLAVEKAIKAWIDNQLKEVTDEGPREV